MLTALPPVSPLGLDFDLQGQKETAWPLTGAATPLQAPPRAVMKTQQNPRLNTIHTELVSITEEQAPSPLLAPRVHAWRNEVLSFTTERGDIAVPSPAVTRPPSVHARFSHNAPCAVSPVGFTSEFPPRSSSRALPSPPKRLQKAEIRASITPKIDGPKPALKHPPAQTLVERMKTFLGFGPSHKKPPVETCATETKSIRSALVVQAEELLASSRSFEPLTNGFVAPESEVVLKAKAIVHTAQRPIDHVVDITRFAIEAAVIRTLMHTKTLQFLPKYGGLGVAELSLLTHVEEDLLSRLLSAALGFGFLAYNSSCRKYRHTRLSAAYAEPSSLVASFFTSVYDVGLAPLVALPGWLEEKSRPNDKKLGSRDAHIATPFTFKVRNHGGNPCDILAKMPEKMSALQNAMPAMEMIFPYTGSYPFDKLVRPDSEDKRFSLVDVGGGLGHAIGAILAAYPDMRPGRCILQDRAEVIALAKEGGVLPAGVRTQVHDYFGKQPVKGARAYHLRAALRNQSDENCIRILRRIVPAMARDSVVLIAENVVSEEVAARSSLVSYMDLIMMSVGGKERTAGEFAALVEAAGLEMVKVWRADKSSVYGVVECKLRR